MTDLTKLSRTSLFDLNAPLLAKLNRREALTDAELDLHFAIGHEVLRQEAAQRIRDRQARDERRASRYHRRPECSISQDEAAGLNTFYSGVEA